MIDLKFEVMYLPPYSCCLNPIESSWALIKRKWVKLNVEELTVSDDIIE